MTVQQHKIAHCRSTNIMNQVLVGIGAEVISARAARKSKYLNAFLERAEINLARIEIIAHDINLR